MGRGEQTEDECVQSLGPFRDPLVASYRDPSESGRKIEFLAGRSGRKGARSAHTERRGDQVGRTRLFPLAGASVFD